MTWREPLSNEAKHAFLLAVQHKKFPRNVLKAIFEHSVIVERRLGTRPTIPSISQHELLAGECGPDDLMMQGLSLDLPPP